MRSSGIDGGCQTLGRIAALLRHRLENRFLPWHLAALVMLLCGPALSAGWIGDDHFHRAVLTRGEIPMIPHSPAELFVFIKGDELVNRSCVAMGILPWWSHQALRLAFFRPLAGLTHWLDYALWPQRPSLMHLHSLAWYGLAVITVTFLYRRMLPCAWVAGLAALLFAVDDARGLPAVWLANRNTLVGVCFGVLTLIAHDKWRKDGRQTGAVLAPATFLLGLLAKESTVATAAYLLSYAVFLDRARWTHRVGSLTPYVFVGAAWWMVYTALGYGATGSGWYINPVTDPVQFGRLAAVRAPMLMAWQWLIPSQLEWALAPSTAQAVWLATVGMLLLVAVGMLPLLYRDAVARFWALGMILAVLPACTVYASGRLLSFVSIGGMGLLAQFIAAVISDTKALPYRSGRRVATRVLSVILIVIHLGIAPVSLARTAGNHKRWGTIAARAAESLPSEPATLWQTTLIVNTPTYAVYSYAVLTRLLSATPYLSRTMVLGSGPAPIEIHRSDARTLHLRLGDAFLSPETSGRFGGEMAQVLFDQRRQFPALDRLYRDYRAMNVGQRITFIGASAEITAVSADRRPMEVTFQFSANLDSRRFRWLQWQNGAYVRFTPPAIGETVTLPAVTMPFQS